MAMTPAPDELRDYVAELVDNLGTVKAAEKLGVGRGMVMGVLAGTPMQAGSIALLKRAMASLINPPPDECA
jgi:hypothetical protein